MDSVHLSCWACPKAEGGDKTHVLLDMAIRLNKEEEEKQRKKKEELEGKMRRRRRRRGRSWKKKKSNGNSNNNKRWPCEHSFSKRLQVYPAVFKSSSCSPNWKALDEHANDLLRDTKHPLLLAHTV